jgi:hypothetical protein
LYTICTHVVVVLSEDVGRDHAGEHVSVLVVVGVVLNVYQSLAVSVTEVRAVGRAEMNFLLGKRVFHLVVSFIEPF